MSHLRHADFGLAGKFDFVSAERHRENRFTLHIYISKKSSFDIPIPKYQRRIQATPDCHFIITAASAFTLPSAKVLLTVYFSPSKE